MSLFRQRVPPIRRFVRRPAGQGALWCARCGGRRYHCRGKLRCPVCEPAARPLPVPRVAAAG